MDTMELFNYYSLDECTDRKKVISTLKKLEKEGKIEYELEKSTDIFEIEDQHFHIQRIFCQKSTR